VFVGAGILRNAESCQGVTRGKSSAELLLRTLERPLCASFEVGKNTYKLPSIKHLSRNFNWTSMLNKHPSAERFASYPLSLFRISQPKILHFRGSQNYCSLTLYNRCATDAQQRPASLYSRKDDHTKLIMFNSCNAGHNSCQWTAAATPIATTIASCKCRVRGLTKVLRSQVSYVFLLERCHLYRSCRPGIRMKFPVIS